MKKSLPALTSLRFFAAALIVLQHANGYFKVGESFSSSYNLGQAVTFFFVLSGFILTYNYPKLERLDDSLEFIWARISRIWPVHFFIFLVLLLIMLYTHQPFSLEQAFANMTLTQAWHHKAVIFFAFNAVSWSLSVELFFYCMFPLLIWKFQANWLSRLKLSAMLGLLAIWMAISTRAVPFTGLEAYQPTISSWVNFWPPARLFEFVCGMVAACLWMKYQLIIDSKLKLSIFKATVIEFLVVILILWASVQVPLYTMQLFYTGIISMAVHAWVYYSGSAPFYALLLFVFAFGRGYLSTLLSVKPLILLGEISFSLYLVHQPIIRCVEYYHNQLMPIPLTVQYTAYWLIILICSYFMWYFIEKPCQKKMKKLPNYIKSLRKTTPNTAESTLANWPAEENRNEI
ncbi:acyltransferase family protein [Legionella beliardensis]|nr:acyltransferase [Legionella beliardensis]